MLDTPLDIGVWGQHSPLKCVNYWTIFIEILFVTVKAFVE